MIIDWEQIEEDFKDHLMLCPEGRGIGEWCRKYWDSIGGRNLYFDGIVRRKELRQTTETPEEGNPVAPEGE